VVDDDNDHVDEVRLCLWTAATNGPIVYPPGDTWARWSTMNWYSQSRTPDSSIRAICRSYHQLPSSKPGRTGRRNGEFGLIKYLFHTQKGFLPCRKTLRNGGDGFSSPPNEGVLGRDWTREPCVQYKYSKYYTTVGDSWSVGLYCRLFDVVHLLTFTVHMPSGKAFSFGRSSTLFGTERSIKLSVIKLPIKYVVMPCSLWELYSHT
jgi:hypothetical protein